MWPIRGIIQSTATKRLNYFRPPSPHVAEKLMGCSCTVSCREGYGKHATNGILFNHESLRRSETFVLREILRTVTAISRGNGKKLYIGNLDALVGDVSKAELELGWKVRTHWRELAELMVDADIEADKTSVHLPHEPDGHE